VRRPPYFRREGVTPNRGNNVARRGAGSRPDGSVIGASQKRNLKQRVRIGAPEIAKPLRTSKASVVGSNRHSPNIATKICMQISVIARKRQGRPERLALEPPSFLKATLPDELAASPPGWC